MLFQKRHDRLDALGVTRHRGGYVYDNIRKRNIYRLDQSSAPAVHCRDYLDLHVVYDDFICPGEFV